jgi:hypothetical protein
MHARYYKNLGRYDLCSNDKSWCVQLITSYGNFSETFPEDEEPHIEGLLPSEILDLIEERLDSYWICTKRDEIKKRIADARKHFAELDICWIQNRISYFEEKIKRLQNQMSDIQEESEKEINHD